MGGHIHETTNKISHWEMKNTTARSACLGLERMEERGPCPRWGGKACLAILGFFHPIPRSLRSV